MAKNMLCNIRQERFTNCVKFFGTGRSSYFEGWGVDAKSLGAKAAQTDKQTDMTGGACCATRNTSGKFNDCFLSKNFQKVYRGTGGGLNPVTRPEFHS